MSHVQNHVLTCYVTSRVIVGQEILISTKVTEVKLQIVKFTIDVDSKSDAGLTCPGDV